MILSIEKLLKSAQEKNLPLSQIVLQDQADEMEMSKEDLYARMAENLQVMRGSVIEGSSPQMRSSSGLTGGAAAKMWQRVKKGENICGDFFGKAVARALAVSECNACMGRIVASPTAGSCGVLPAAVLTMMEEKNLSEDTGVMALFTAAGIGMVIAENATISGAQGGCQAEVGSASAMAAAAVAEMSGGTPEMCVQACTIALQNIMGLVCDPVAGLVEVPCVKRNAMGVANALAAAEIACAGIKSPIPADEVILAMKRVGDALPQSLRETAEGGLAATPCAREITCRLFGKQGGNFLSKI